MRWLHDGQVTEYEPTQEDVLMLARAVAHEGPPHDAVAWALVQRFALLYPRYYSTLADLVQAYSQPINPRWFPDGDRHLAELKALSPDQQADEIARSQRRVKYAQETWDELPDFAKRAALNATAGLRESPVPRAVHFRASRAPAGATKRQAKERAEEYASTRTDLESVIRVPDGYKRGLNWFFSSPSSATLQMLTDIDEPSLARGGTPGPKDPPPGVPVGPGWGWAWCYSPPSPSVDPDADSPLPASDAEEPAADSSASEAGSGLSASVLS